MDEKPMRIFGSPRKIPMNWTPEEREFLLALAGDYNVHIAEVSNHPGKAVQECLRRGIAPHEIRHLVAAFSTSGNDSFQVLCTECPPWPWKTQAEQNKRLAECRRLFDS